ncbi:MAG TPA: class I SAM-dependent methyltransferase [Dermatophilaceae bacterium]|nr:class I SAM-dependent methyltransferase [Dermatophilaceae bacterium]
MAGRTPKAADRTAPYRTRADRTDPDGTDLHPTDRHRWSDRWSDRWWTLVSRVYDPAVGLVGWHGGLRDLVDDIVTGTVLDAGCGPAYLAQVLTARGVAYVGVDCNAAMLSRARGRPLSGQRPDAAVRDAAVRGAAARSDFVQADLAALPFADSTFDVVLATGVLGLLELGHRGTALREMARVSKRGVRLLEPVHRPGAPARLARARLIGLVRDRPLDLGELAAAGLHVESVGAPLLAGVYTPVRAGRV